jgi:GeoRSP system SPASM domain protein
MSLGELPTPVRASWDLPEPLAARAHLPLITQRLIAGGLLAVELWERAPTVPSDTLSVIAAFVAAQRAVSLTLAPAALEAGPPLAGLGLRQLLVHAQGPEEALALVPRRAACRELARTVGLAVAPTNAAALALPRILAACLTHGVRLVELPIPRAARGEPGVLLGDAARTALARRLRAIDYGGLCIIVHDPFLTAALTPDAPLSGDDGCQAANSLVHVTPAGQVEACPVLPVPLGDLSRAPLADIMAGAARQGVRAAVRALPAGCRGCPTAGYCQGGCRGRARRHGGSLAQRDPACVTGLRVEA